MNLKQFRYVLVLSQEGSFSAAAEVLGISQPSLSQYVKKIENEIGMSLFDRTGGNVRLTDAGHAYIEAGRKILDIEHRMQGILDDLRENKTGTIRIGTSPFRSASAMPQIVKAFKEKYPGVCIEIYENDTASLMEGLARGEYDLCLTMLPVDENAFSYEKIYDEEIVLASPSTYPALDAVNIPERKYPAVDFTKIDGQKFVLLTEGQFMQRIFNSLCMDRGLNVHAGVVVKNLETQIAMVRAGVGMACVSSEARSLDYDGSIRFYSFVQDLPQRKVVAVWRREVALTNTQKDLVETIKNYYNR